MLYVGKQQEESAPLSLSCKKKIINVSFYLSLGTKQTANILCPVGYAFLFEIFFLRNLAAMNTTLSATKFMWHWLFPCHTVYKKNIQLLWVYSIYYSVYQYESTTYCILKPASIKYVNSCNKRVWSSKIVI